MCAEGCRNFDWMWLGAIRETGEQQDEIEKVAHGLLNCHLEYVLERMLNGYSKKASCY